jgi:hypothetical protein
MENSESTKTFLSSVDSIQLRFMERFTTGQRDPTFRETEPKRRPEYESEGDPQRQYLQSLPKSYVSWALW